MPESGNLHNNIYVALYILPLIIDKVLSMGFRNRFKGAFDSSQKKDDDSKSQENIRNFKYLSNLLESGKKEVILDSDITLSDGEEEEYFNGIRLDADDVIIDGDGHSIDAAGKARIFKVAGENIQLKNITFMNGSSGEGGAIYVDNFARAEIMDCVFKDNSADKNGSALINLGEIDLKGVEFAQNNSIGGGTLYNEVVGKVALTGCSFTDNTSQHGSGAFINFGKARFDDVKLERNTSQEGGGGAVNNQKGGSIKMTDSSFTDNASRTGGGALINYGKVTLNSVNFAGN